MPDLVWFGYSLEHCTLRQESVNNIAMIFRREYIGMEWSGMELIE